MSMSEVTVIRDKWSFHGLVWTEADPDLGSLNSSKFTLTFSSDPGIT